MLLSHPARTLTLLLPDVLKSALGHVALAACLCGCLLYLSAPDSVQGRGRALALTILPALFASVVILSGFLTGFSAGTLCRCTALQHSVRSLGSTEMFLLGQSLLGLTQVGPRLCAAIAVGIDPQGKRFWRLEAQRRRPISCPLFGRDRRDSAAGALWNVSPNDELREAEEISAQGGGPVDRLAP